MYHFDTVVVGDFHPDIDGGVFTVRTVMTALAAAIRMICDDEDEKQRG